MEPEVNRRRPPVVPRRGDRGLFFGLRFVRGDDEATCRRRVLHNALLAKRRKGFSNGRRH